MSFLNKIGELLRHGYCYQIEMPLCSTPLRYFGSRARFLYQAVRQQLANSTCQTVKTSSSSTEVFPKIHQLSFVIGINKSTHCHGPGPMHYMALTLYPGPAQVQTKNGTNYKCTGANKK
jgi:hypothetical protein